MRSIMLCRIDHLEKNYPILKTHTEMDVHLKEL